MNEMNFSQAATVLTNIVEQATGQKVITPINTPQDFVAVAQTALRTGYDPILNAISQVWTNTIFSHRPLTLSNRALEMSISKWGNATRKISPVSMSAQDDPAYMWPVAFDSVNHPGNPLGDGESVDHYKIHKQRAVQTNFYGSAVYKRSYSTFSTQLETAFSSPEEFARFNAMNVEERANDLIRYKEAVGMGLQVNHIGALLAENNTDRVVHLITEYNAETGSALTGVTVYQPENFAPFMRWAWARIKSIVRFMGKDSEKYQTVINGNHILRHTDPANMRIAMLAQAYDKIETMVLSDTFNDEYLKGITFEPVAFWQSIDSPDSVNIKPVYTDTDGGVKQSETAISQTGVFALLHDRDGLGYCFTGNKSIVTPINAEGDYYNTVVHSKVRTISDMTEKAVVLLLD